MSYKICKVEKFRNISWCAMSCPILRDFLSPFLLEKGNCVMLFAPKEKGQGLVEYAIILALVAIVVIAVVRLLGPKIGNTFSTIASSMP